MVKLTDETIVGRVETGRTFMSRFGQIDLNQSRKFRDPKADDVTGTDTDDIISRVYGLEDAVTEVTEGTLNQQAANILTKIAAIGIGEPAITVSISPEVDPEDAKVYEQIVPAYFKYVWRAQDLRRVAAHVLTKRSICGLGWAFYRWDPTRAFVVEPAHSWEMAVDPFVSINEWRQPAWLARRLVVSRRMAEARFGKAWFGTTFPETADVASLDSEPVTIWCYYDADREAYLHDGKIINKIEGKIPPNMYEGIPVLVLQGDYDPSGSVFPLGDTQMVAGLQSAMTELFLTLYYTALHGGPLNVVDETMVKGSVEEAWQKGRQGGIIGVKGAVRDAIMRYPGETVSPALAPTIQQFMSAMDGLMGVSAYDRGVVDRGVNFATEAVLINQRSGARAVQARREYEEWLRSLAVAMIRSTAKFGGPVPGQPRTSDADMLWDACSAVTDVMVVGSSTSYKDPQTDQQPLLALFQTIVQAIPALVQTGQPVPNVKAVVDQVYRAFGFNDPDQFWIAAPGAPEEEVNG
jgi:hypothetical protein